MLACLSLIFYYHYHYQYYHSYYYPFLQALGYLPPELPSLIRFGYQLKQEMHVTAKVYDNSSKLDSGTTSSMSIGKVMVFRGKLSDNSPAVAKLPATVALLAQEVRFERNG